MVFRFFIILKFRPLAMENNIWKSYILIFISEARCRQGNDTSAFFARFLSTKNITCREMILYVFILCSELQLPCSICFILAYLISHLQKITNKYIPFFYRFCWNDVIQAALCVIKNS